MMIFTGAIGVLHVNRESLGCDTVKWFAYWSGTVGHVMKKCH